ncbi:recombinase family protein [Streptomyces sp. NPDC047002]|uniref:recombinase family protein n=1 Tax=Streptomyces sp. NPDC047002 TaxID=3155475 RepID=UPI0034517193
MPETAHGYMRTHDAGDEEIEAEQDRMRHWAAARGWRLAGVHEEDTEGAFTALDELVGALRESGGRHVLVPSFLHLGAHLVLQAQVVDHLLCTTGAEIHSTGGPR